MRKMIEFKDVDFMYEKDLVLDKVSLCVHDKEFVALIGVNGAGKSTLLRLLVGELHPMSGSVKLLGENSTQFSQYKSVGYVAQTTAARSINFQATVSEVVMANLYSDIGRFKFPKKEHKEKVRRALTLVGMQDHTHDLINDLSGGQQQRVMLARALVSEPELMILDEPTAGIDKQSTSQFYDLLHSLNQEGLTILLVTHHVDELIPYLSRTTKLIDGKIFDIDPTKEHH